VKLSAFQHSKILWNSRTSGISQMLFLTWRNKYSPHKNVRQKHHMIIVFAFCYRIPFFLVKVFCKNGRCGTKVYGNLCFGCLKRDDWQVVPCIVKHELHKKRICDVESSFKHSSRNVFFHIGMIERNKYTCESKTVKVIHSCKLTYN